MKTSKLKRLTIFGVEQTFKNKFWIILNILMLLASIIYINFGTIKDIIDKNFGTEDKDILKVMIQDETNSFEQKLKNVNDEKIQVVDYSDTGIEEGNILVDIKYDETDFIKVKITSSEYIDMNKYTKFEEIVNNVRDEEFARRNNLTIEDVKKASSKVEIERVITSLDKELFEKYSRLFLIASLIIYMLFMFISSSLASTIGMEKVSRTTEYMLTGISENAYLWYNILQTNIVVIIQSALSAVYIVIATLIKSLLMSTFLGVDVSIASNGISDLTLNLNLEPQLILAIVIFLIQVILSILILSIIQAVLSSRVNNISDISNSTVLVLFFVIFATVLFPTFIPTGEAVNIFLKIVSFIPVISAVAVPKLVLLGQIPNIIAIMSIVVSIVSIIFLTIFGSKEFKKGLLSRTKGSKKEERVSKLKVEDFNAVKFKNAITRVSMSLIIYLIVSNLVGIISKLAFPSVTGVVNYIVQILTWIISIYPSYWYLKNSNYDKSKKENIERIPIKKCIITMIVAFGIIWGIQLLMEKIDNTNGIVNLINLSFNNIFECVLAVIYIALLPAIFEELLFRKAIYGSLKKYGKVIAMVISALAFGLVHQNLSQGLFAFVIGIVFCIVNEKTGTIFSSMILHFINNFISVIQLIMINNIGEERTLSIFNSINVLLVIYSILSVMIVIFYFVYNRIKGNPIITSDENSLKVVNPVKVIFSDFVTVLTTVIFVIITICVTKLI